MKFVDFKYLFGLVYRGLFVNSRIKEENKCDILNLGLILYYERRNKGDYYYYNYFCVEKYIKESILRRFGWDRSRFRLSKMVLVIK